jgi:hypothetical protein
MHSKSSFTSLARISNATMEQIDVSTQTRNLPVLEMAFPFPVMAPISSTVLLMGSHFWKFSIWHGTQTGNLPLLALGVTHLYHFRYWASHFRYWAMPFPARSFTGPVPELDSMPWSHFRYRALPVLARSFLGSHTGTGIYVCGPISGTGLCQFRYGPHGVSLSQILDRALSLRF